MQIFPQKFLEFSNEYYLKGLSKRSQVIYSSILLLFIAILISLPFIYVDTYTQSRGIVKTLYENNNIYAPVTAQVQKNYIKENMVVTEGDTLVVLDNNDCQSEIEAKQYDVDLHKKYISDLRTILKNYKNESWENISLSTPLYINDYNSFIEKRNELGFNLTLDEKKTNRVKVLYTKQLISDEEYENQNISLKVSISRYEQLIKSQLTEWQVSLKNYEQELRQLNVNLETLYKEREKYFIIAPIDGTIQELQGIQENGFIIQNQVIAKISPKDRLIAEIVVPPSDIGLIYNKQETNFQIDAFNYREWGQISGQVIEIGSDVVISDNTPYFKVKCNLNESNLTLSNGYKGVIKKGMTLTANFMLNRRSLYNLLFDKIDNWVDPRINGLEE